MKKLAQAGIAVSPGTLLYTVSNGFSTDVTQIDIANTTTGTLTCAIHLVPSGGAVATTNMLFPTISIPANTLIQWTGGQHLNMGDFIQGIGSAAGITVNITGNESR